MALADAAARLLADHPVASGRVFAGDLPKAEHASMPRECVTVRSSGGAGAGSHWMRTGRQRLDVKSYGATPYEAAWLDFTVGTVLQLWKQSTVTITDPDGNDFDLKVGSFTHVGGPNELVDPDTDWPFTLSVWEVWGDRYTGG